MVIPEETRVRREHGEGRVGEVILLDHVLGEVEPVSR